MSPSIELGFESVLNHCSIPITLESLEEKTGLNEGRLYRVTSRLEKLERLGVYRGGLKNYYFIPSEENYKTARICSLPDSTKKMFDVLFESPMTVDELSKHLNFEMDESRRLLGQIRKRELLIEDYLGESFETKGKKIYSTNPGHEDELLKRSRRRREMKLVKDLCNVPKTLDEVVEESGFKYSQALNRVRALVKGNELTKHKGNYTYFYFSPSEENQTLAKFRSLSKDQVEAYEILNKTAATTKELSVMLGVPVEKVNNILFRLRRDGLLYDIVEHPKKFYFTRPELRANALEQLELERYKKDRKLVNKIFELLKDEALPAAGLLTELEDSGVKVIEQRLSTLLYDLEEKGILRHRGTSARTRWYIPPELEENDGVKRHIIDYIERFMTIDGLREFRFSTEKLADDIGVEISDVGKLEKMDIALSEMIDVGLAELEGDKYLFKEDSYPELLVFQKSTDVLFDILEQDVVKREVELRTKHMTIQEYLAEYGEQILEIAQKPVTSKEISEKTDIPQWKIENILPRLLEDGSIKKYIGRGVCYFVPSDENKRLAQIRTMGKSQKEVYEMLQEKPLPIYMIAEELDVTTGNITSIVHSLLKKGFIYRAIAKEEGSRGKRGYADYLYVKPEHKDEAVLKSIGLDAPEIVQFIEEGGPKNTQELANHLNKKFSSSIQPVLKNLIAHEILKIKKSYGVNTYYIGDDDSEELTIKLLGPRSEEIYGYLKTRPMTTKEVAESTETTIENVSIVLNRLKDSELIKKDDTTQPVVWYTDEHVKEAIILSSGNYAKEIYEMGKQGPIGVFDVKKQLNLSQSRASRLMNRLEERGVFNKKVGRREAVWYVPTRENEFYAEMIYRCGFMAMEAYKKLLEWPKTTKELGVAYSALMKLLDEGYVKRIKDVGSYNAAIWFHPLQEMQALLEVGIIENEFAGLEEKRKIRKRGRDLKKSLEKAKQRAEEVEAPEPELVEPVVEPVVEIVDELVVVEPIIEQIVETVVEPAEAIVEPKTEPEPEPITPIEPPKEPEPIPPSKPVKTELWIRMGLKGEEWLRLNLGYGPKTDSKDVLQALKEHGNMKIEDLRSYKVYIGSDEKGLNFLKELDRRRAIEIYEKEVE